MKPLVVLAIGVFAVALGFAAIMGQIPFLGWQIPRGIASVGFLACLLVLFLTRDEEE